MRSCSIALIALFCAAFAAAEAVAQPGGRGGPGGQRGGRPNPMGVASLLFNEQVREEIELLEDQEMELRAVGDEMRDRMRSIFSGMRDLPPDERRAAFEGAREEMESFRDEVEERVRDVLMPNQFERLRQIELQQQMRQRGGAALSNGRVADALGLSAEQQEAMQRKAAESQQRLREKIQELRNEAREEVLSVLTSEQRSKYDAMVGQPFEMEDDRGFGRGGRRGGFRQRGEERPSGDRGRPELE